MNYFFHYVGHYNSKVYELYKKWQEIQDNVKNLKSHLHPLKKLIFFFKKIKNKQKHPLFKW